MRSLRVFLLGLVTVLALLAMVRWLPAGSIGQAAPVPLDVVEVGAPAINCIFDVGCSITVTDTTDHFTLSGTTGDAFLQSRTFPPGEAGTPAEGLIGYLYRLDLRDLTADTANPCVTQFSIEFGPVVDTLDYDVSTDPDDVFVITAGGLGSVGLASADQVDATITFEFDGAGVCLGQSSYFFGLTSANPPRSVVAQIRDTSGVVYELDARAPSDIIASPTPTPVPSHSLRIGTFNTFLVSPIFYHKFVNDPEIVRRANQIPEAICNSSFDYDVIALNEVWGEDFKSTMVDKLSDCGYPHYVEHVEIHAVPEDSGLMIFSRLPFAKLEPLYTPITYPIGAIFHVESSGTKVRYLPFLEAAGIDQAANKGAALVRLFDPGSGVTYTVLFTHTDAAPAPHSSQFRTIMEVIDPVIDPVIGVRTSEPFFILGDLNVDGDDRTAGSEWSTYFAPGATESGGFFVSTMFDAWADMTALDRPDDDDPGLTAPGRTKRLDYILMSRSAQRCVQHMKLEFGGLSDHIGVAADINLDAPQCSPQTASNPVEEWRDTHPRDLDGWNGTEFEGRLEHPGSMQWFRFDKGDTWAFATRGDGVEFEVYESRNLTDPIGQYEGETTRVQVGNDVAKARKYLIPEPPFYVRVFHPDRTRAGVDYRLLIYRHGCTSMNDACALYPNHRYFNPNVPTDRPLPTDDTAWFQLDTERADSGEAQQLRFLMRRKGPPLGTLALQVRDEHGTVILDSGPSRPRQRRLDLNANDVGESKLFLTVKRVEERGYFPGFKVKWETDLAILHSLETFEFRLRSIAESGIAFAGDDEIVVEVRVDGEHLRTFSNPDMDTGDFIDMAEIAPIRFLSSVIVGVFEEDVFSDDFGHFVITMPRNEFQQLRQKPKITIFNIISDGEYRLHYNLSRRLEDP